MYVGRKLRNLANNNKVLKFSRWDRQVGLTISLNRGNLEELGCFRYLEMDMAVDRTMGAEMKCRVDERAKF